MATLFERFSTAYPIIVLAIVSIGFVVSELGHFLIGVTSKAIAIDLHYGDIACQFNSTKLRLHELPALCHTANDSDT